MNIAAAGKLALCICTGAVVGAGVNEARHNADKPKAVKTASKNPARKVVQFPCEPYIVQDQMMRDAQIPSDFEATDLPEYAELILPGGGGSGGGGGDDDGDGGGDGGGGAIASWRARRAASVSTLRIASSSASRSRVISASSSGGSVPRNCATRAVRARS